MCIRDRATTPEEWLSAIDRAVTEADDEELAKQRIALSLIHICTPKNSHSGWT